MFGALFDFVRDVGDKLFTSDTEAADAIRAHIDKDNPGIIGLRVDYADGCVTLHGAAKDQAAREKCVLMAGNVKGVDKVEADDLVLIPPKAPEAEATSTAAPTASAAPAEPAADDVPAARFYTIQKGDTLWKIAAETLGNGARYKEIFEANREVIRDADRIYPGQKIRIPD